MVASPKKLTQSQSVPCLCLILAIVTFAAYWPVFQNGFVNYDDEDYVSQNPQVQAGLTLQGTAWAFTTSWASNWHPLTWLSHQLDCQLFGQRPAGHHGVNLLLHTVNVVLLFLVLLSLCRVQRKGTKEQRRKEEDQDAEDHATVWRSGIVAGLFALHPMHVQSVAWVSERKDVLSALFFLLTIWAYIQYAKGEDRGGKVQSSKFKVQGSRFRAQAIWYGLALALFACALMSKPMVVTLPFVLLLLDYWPLSRVSSFGFLVSSAEATSSNQKLENRNSKLLLEKIPFLALAAVSCWITYRVQQAGGAVAALGHVSLGARIGNAVVSYARYLAKLIWPADLAVFYPPEKWAWWQIGGAAAVLAAITAAVVWLGCKEAVDTRTGKGSPPFALRPSPLLIGWFWFLGMLVPVIGLVQVGAQAMADRYSYLPSIGLFVALVWALGTDSRQEKRGEGAALWNGRGAPGVLSIIAVSLLLAAFAIRTHIEAKYWHDSETLFRRALAVTSDNEYAEFSLGNALCDNGQTAEGLERLQKVLAIDPTFAEVEARVAFVLAGQGKYDEALRHYKKAMESRPDLTGALNNLAWMRATHPDARYRDGAEAVQLALRACELTHYEKTIFIGTLAAAYAEAGRFAEAAAAAQRAIDHALAWKENDLAQRNRQLLELYRAGKAYHEGSTK